MTKKLLALLLLPAAALAQTATYDATTYSLVIPSLSVSGKTFSNVTISTALGSIASGSTSAAEGTNDGIYQCSGSGGSFYIAVISNTSTPSCLNYSGTVKNSIVTGVSTGYQPFQYASGCSVIPSSGSGFFSGTGSDGKLVHLFFNGGNNFYWAGDAQFASCAKSF